MKNQTVFSLLAGVFLTSSMALAQDRDGPSRWWKGNTHTHTWWSDGDSPPETVADWYRRHGYQFLVLSDHNITQEGTKWYPVVGDDHKKALASYVERFGEDWVEQRAGAESLEVRLKTLEEFRTKFEVSGEFIFIPGEEITDRFERSPVHLNGINLAEMIRPQGGKSVFDVMQRNVDAVHAQARRTGRPMLVHLNHPNFHWGVRAEDIMRLDGEKFFEIHNGHPAVRNYGDQTYASTERMWDIILAKRLGELNLPVMYGIACDDAHDYTDWGVGKANPGRGWVMVRAKELSAASIIQAMNAGQYYCSTGVTLRDVRYANQTMHVDVDAESDVTYKISFIGTKRGFDPRGKPVDGDARAYVTLRYGKEIGQELAESEGTSASYTLSGEELYVRAKITSDKPHANPYAKGDFEVAWTQPVVPKSR